MFNPIEPIKKAANTWIENTDAVTVGKTLAGVLAIGAGVGIIIFSNTGTDEVVEEVVEEVAEQVVDNADAAEDVVEVVAEVIDAVE